jgi:hypothetical protein
MIARLVKAAIVSLILRLPVRYWEPVSAFVRRIWKGFPSA